ncbi:MAG: SpoIIE family protein phosphatase [Peptoniphilus sp.]|uniref:SpoIIE family protein phosphatase n=1 Tax=Peptoniphilus sp. TaxID=1971214 RepID=UPI0025CBE1F8|nr:SpoIIE family protein phosphatase [Peptoniphilus sp.]MCI5643896.1 SpoIIE family protein phosphatase [Peptoniphilus sp.]MDY3903560.1 SpoIIE family protein phosphatase [Peptoniphilus sp.]
MENYLAEELTDDKVDFQVLNAIADLVRVLDYNEKVVFVNKAMEDLLGYDSDKKVCILGEDLFDPEITRRALLSGEVIQREENIGGMVFSVKCSPITNKKGEIKGVVEVFRNVTMARKLQKEIIEKNRFMTSETMAASLIQRTVLPEKGFIKNLKVNYIYKPSTILSGDMFDVFEIDDENIAVYIADSVGHGFAASMVTMFIKSMIRTLDKLTLLSPKKTLTELCTRFISLRLEIENYFTCFYGVYNTKKKKIIFSNAGHLPLPIMVRDRGFMNLESKGYPISRFFAKPNYEEKEVKLYSGDYILYMTDGVVESRNSKKESFGYDKIHNIILENNRDVLEVLDSELEEFNDGEQTDDISMLLINVW